MLFFRKILAVVIALALAFSPVAVAAGSVHSDNASTVSMTSAAAVAMGSMSMGADAAMADCEKSMASGDCTCCDAKSKCTDQATCTMKCSKVLTRLSAAARLSVHSDTQYRSGGQDMLLAWVSAPPAPPPRS